MPGLTQYLPSMAPLPAHLNNDNEATRNLVAELFTFIFGSVNALPMPGPGVAPLSIVPTPNALSYTIGGPGQMVIVGQRIADTCPAFPQPITPNNSGADRIDLVSIQYAQVQENPSPDSFDTGGTISTGSVYQLADSITYRYDVGTAAGPPSPQAGFTPFAYLTVPNGASAISSANVALQIPTTQALADALVGAIVLSMNGLTGALSVANGPGITVDFPKDAQGNQTIIRVGNAGVIALGGKSGALTLSGPSGSGIVVTAVDGGFEFENSGVTTLNGSGGDHTFLKGDGIDIDTPTPTQTRFTNTGLLTFNGARGHVTLREGDTNVKITESSQGSGDFVIDVTPVPGPRGPAGADGANGQAGRAGRDGVDGKQGDKGEKGDKGNDGQAGRNGTNGIDGAAGTRGADGAPGGEGPQGRPGTDIAATQMANRRIGGTSPQTVQLPAALQPGTWDLYASANIRSFGVRGVIVLTGGNAAGWEAQTGSGGNNADFMMVELIGTAGGGDQPSVTVTFLGVTTAEYGGILHLLAVRRPGP